MQTHIVLEIVGRQGVPKGRQRNNSEKWEEELRVKREDVIIQNKNEEC